MFSFLYSVVPSYIVPLKLRNPKSLRKKSSTTNSILYYYLILNWSKPISVVHVSDFAIRNTNSADIKKKNMSVWNVYYLTNIYFKCVKP